MIKQHQLLPLLCSFSLFFLIPCLESVTQCQTKKLADLKKKKKKKITKLQNHHPHQYALVDVASADALHTDPDDTWVSNLFVVDGQRSLRRAAGGWWRLSTRNQRRRAEVRVRGAAGGAGQTGGKGRHGGEILCNIVKGAWERLRERKRKYKNHVPILKRGSQWNCL